METKESTSTAHFTKEEIAKIVHHFAELTHDCKEIREILLGCSKCGPLAGCVNKDCKNRLCNDCYMLHHCDDCNWPLCEDCAPHKTTEPYTICKLCSAKLNDNSITPKRKNTGEGLAATTKVKQDIGICSYCKEQVKSKEDLFCWTCDVCQKKYTTHHRHNPYTHCSGDNCFNVCCGKEVSTDGEGCLTTEYTCKRSWALCTECQNAWCGDCEGNALIACNICGEVFCSHCDPMLHRYEEACSRCKDVEDSTEYSSPREPEVIDLT